MGKTHKFGENTKAKVARERKEEQEALKEKERLRKKEIEEAASWSDGKKPSKKELDEQKRLKKLEAKKEREMLLKEEESGMKSAKPIKEKYTEASIKIDKHPERRVKAAFIKFEEENMPRLKEENPNLRYTQLKDLLYKEWKKSEQNPMNQSEIQSINSIM